VKKEKNGDIDSDADVKAPVKEEANGDAMEVDSTQSESGKKRQMKEEEEEDTEDEPPVKRQRTKPAEEKEKPKKKAAAKSRADKAPAKSKKAAGKPKAVKSADTRTCKGCEGQEEGGGEVACASGRRN
jgi:DNA ligase-1